MENQRCGLPRGKGLGGGSIINYMVYSRGHRNDYDRWAAAGNTGWSWDEVLPYFLKSERATLRNLRHSKYHNRHGWLSVEYVPWRSTVSKAFVESHKYLGLNEVDYNTGDQLGVAYLQATTKKGQRHSAYRAYLEPILGRSNLHIMVNTRVTKILIDPKTKTAYGAEFLRNRRRTRVVARKEVILSAGAFASPQLLMLSGIGMKKEMSRLGIPLIKNLAVGAMMYDHLSYLGPTIIVNTTRQSFKVQNSFRPGGFEDFLDYLNNGRGPLTVPGGVEALSFIKTETNEPRGPNVPDVELMFIAGSFHSDGGAGISKGLRIKSDIYNSVYKPLEDADIDTYSTMLVLFHPKSVGHLRLKTSNPMKHPLIYPNYLNHPDDVETLLEAIKFALKLVQTPPFQRLGARLYSAPVPTCAHIHFGSDNYWRCTLRVMASTLHHQMSTCKMGPANDPMAVVSTELKVHGINKLRVVDTSIIPEASTAHPNAASFMMGEKAADMIKREWQTNYGY